MINMPKPYNLGYAQVIPKNGETFKFPMLIVGANNYSRENVKFTTIQKYDVYYFFYPTGEPVWQIGALLVDRTKRVEPIALQTQNTCIQTSFKLLFIMINNLNEELIQPELHEVKSLWLQNSIYRCSKIALKDVLHLDPYKTSEVA